MRTRLSKQIRTSVQGHVPSPGQGVRRIVFAGNRCSTLEIFRGSIIRRLIAEGFEVHIVAPFDAVTPELMAAGARLSDLALHETGRNPLAELSLLRQLHRIYRQIKPDLVFHYTIKLNIFGTLAARRLGIPCVNMVSGLGAFPELENGLVRSVIGRGYSYAAKHSLETWFLNQHDYGFFEARGWLDKVVSRVLPGEGLDTAHYGFKALPETDRLQVLNVGRMLGAKGVRVFAEAAKIVQQRGLPMDFALLGGIESHNPDGVTTDEIAAWIDAGSIEYLGYTRDVRGHLEQADIVVVPTYYREGMNRVIMEAMSIGRPVITTSVPGAGELIEHGQTGYIVPERNAEAIVDALQHHLQLSPAKREHMGRQARQATVTKYDVARVAEHYHDVIARVQRSKAGSVKG